MKSRIFKGIRTIFYAICAALIVFIMFQFACFKPFHGNVYWVFGVGLVTGVVVTSILKKR